MERLYCAGVADAADFEPGEVVDDLVVIRPAEPGLEWREGKVLVTSWTQERVLFHPGKTVPLDLEVWVTPDRVVADFCRPLDAYRTEVRLRLEQVLGLPPGSGRGRRFVEMWVAPEDLFRPCPDPSVTVARCDPARVDPASIPESHRRWLEATAGTVRCPGGYPWTGLGYTYDWGHPLSEVGLTELVVRRGAQVEVERVAGLLEYCDLVH